MKRHLANFAPRVVKGTKRARPPVTVQRQLPFCAPAKIRTAASQDIQRRHQTDFGGGYTGTGHIQVKNKKKRVLITGAGGQIGGELAAKLRGIFGDQNVISSDVKMMSDGNRDHPFCYADVTDYDILARVVLENQVDIIVHLAALLSAVGERNPKLAYTVNNKGLENCLELARSNKLQIYSPSSIAAFGPSSPKDMTPDECVMRPTTIYGVSKVYGELLGEYYHRKFGVDFRALRYPGIISWKALPGGGTTDYAVEIYFEALKKGRYTCFLTEDTMMPMMYMPDTLKATADFITADNSKLTQRVYNVTGMSFTPAEVVAEIRKSIPNFQVEYQPDFRQQIAETWPRSIDDTKAREDWGWKQEFDLASMSRDMLYNIEHTLGLGSVNIPEMATWH